MQTNQDNQTGRRGLFAVNEKDNDKSDNFYKADQLSAIISSIIQYEGEKLSDIPEIFNPLFERVKNDFKKYEKKNQDYENVHTELKDVQDELSIIKKEHETFLSDLISAHTEFDRALEIFQYHSVPMVLTGPDAKILDANEIFCSIFSVERFALTRQFPFLSQYIPDENFITAPDGNVYTTLSLEPPIVPFDHEASALKLLIPCKEESVRDSDIHLLHLFREALNGVLYPLAILDDFNTIQFVNPAFADLIGREHHDLTMRDIGSCGVSADIIQHIDDMKSSGEGTDFQTTITLLNNDLIHVWVKLIPVLLEDNLYILSSFIPDEDEPEPLVEAISDQPLRIDPFIATLLEINPSPIVLFDESYSIIHANEGFSELIGVSTELLHGQKISDIGIDIPEKNYFSEDISILPDEVSIESPYGTISFSGLIISDHSHISSNYTLILQSSTLNKTEETCTRIESDSIAEISVPNPEIIQKNSGAHQEFGLFFNAVPIPLVEFGETQEIRVNSAFKDWTGVSQDDLSQFSSSIITQITQSKSDSSQIFSSVFPNGQKSFRILAKQGYDVNICTAWFIDQTSAYEKINDLEEQIANVRQDIIDLREIGSEETSTLSVNDELSHLIDIVEFELSGGRYAMDIGMVREVVEMLPITPLPKTPPYIIGIINLRGEVTHVLDLGVLLGEGIKKDRTGQKIIIVPPDAARGEHLGIIVDNVRSVTEIGVKQVTSLGEEINTRIHTRIKGIIKVTHDDLIDKREEEDKEGNLVIWLDMKGILNSLAGFN